MVWCPKYRKNIFKAQEVRERTEQIIREISEEDGFEIIEMEESTEHVHILFSFPPKRSIEEVFRVIKSKSVRQLFSEFSSLKRRLWSGELWNDGYFARTVGVGMTHDVIKKHIKHHRELKQGHAQLEFKLR